MPSTTHEPATPRAPEAAEPPAWQGHWGAQIADAMTRCLSVHPAAVADHSREDASPLVNGEALCRLPSRAASTAPARLAALQSPPGAGRLQAQQLYERCLAHYRQNLLAALGADLTSGDDLVGAAACFLAACAQALEGHAVTPERWQALRQWLCEWAPPMDLGNADVLASQQEAFERLATLAAALGEWSVQAQRQGPVAVAGARLMARRWLAQELGIDADALLRALHWQGLVAADNPSWGGAALPKHRTGQRGGHRLK
ncbi:hypothetical protein BurJ1DRAFT_2616 [Burkholderiales bacterium JOSHI_001]|nr:hypothetical protein BurJ1DRAFT_2616 [Burkholderiales bacterium JOSHI_001]